MTEEERFRENIRRDMERAERRAELAREFEQSPYAELTPETAYHFHRIGRPPQLRSASYLPACTCKRCRAHQAAIRNGWLEPAREPGMES